MASNEVRIKVTAQDDTDRTFRAVEKKFRDFASRMKTVSTKVAAKVDDSSFGGVQSQLDRKLSRMRSAAVKVAVTPDISQASMKAFETRLRAFGAVNASPVKIPVVPDIDRGFATRLRAFDLRMKSALSNVGAKGGLAFAAGFLKTLTFGQVGAGFSRAAIKLHPAAAKAGALLGAGMAAALLLQLSNLVTAGIPLILGAGMLAVPIVGLIKPMVDAQKEIEKITNSITVKKIQLIEAEERVREATNKKQREAAKERVRDIKEEIGLLEKNRAELEKLAEPLIRLRDRWGKFIAEISKPVKAPLLEVFELIGDRLKSWTKPVKEAFKELAPVLVPFTEGVLNGIEEFFKAIGREMPGIKAGMQAWADAFPGIARSFGEMVAKILADPERTVQAVKDFAGALDDLATSASAVISFLAGAAEKYGKFAREIDEAERAGAAGIGKGIAQALDDLNAKIEEKLVTARDSVVKWVKKINAKLSGIGGTETEDAAKESLDSFFEKIDDWIGKLPGRVARWVGEVNAELSGIGGTEVQEDVDQNGVAITEKIKNWFKDIEIDTSGIEDAWKDIEDSFAINALKTRLNKFKDWVGNWASDTWKEAKDSFKEGHKEIVDDIKGWYHDVVDWFKKLADKLVGHSIIPDMIDDIVAEFGKLPGKVANELEKMKDRVLDKIESMKDRALAKIELMKDRFIEKMKDLVNKARDQAGRVKDAIVGKFDNAKDWLYNKGRLIVDGFLSGMRDKFKIVKDWVSGIAKWIKDNKGPVSLDRQLLVPAGKALMGGLLEGLKFGFGDVGEFVYKAGSRVSDIISKIKASMLGPGIGGKISGGIGGFLAAIAKRFGIRGGTYPGHGAHGAQNAWDFMIRSKAQGNAIAALGRAVASLVIWNNRIWSRARASEGWRPYTRYGGGGTASQRHTNHVHVEWYKHGGWINEPVMGIGRSGKYYGFGEAGRELVVPAANVARGRGGSGVTVNQYISLPNYVGSHNDMVNALVMLKKQGRLDVVLR
jgi:hypothetical protein